MYRSQNIDLIEWRVKCVKFSQCTMTQSLIHVYNLVYSLTTISDCDFPAPWIFEIYVRWYFFWVLFWLFFFSIFVGRLWFVSTCCVLISVACRCNYRIRKTGRSHCIVQVCFFSTLWSLKLALLLFVIVYLCKTKGFNLVLCASSLHFWN